MAEMIFVSGDDWAGVYVDGKLVSEGHSIQPEEAVELAIAHKVAKVSSRECDYNWLCDQDSLPESIEDVKWIE